VQHVKLGHSLSVQEVSCGKSHTMILTKSGYVYSFGQGDYGQLGHCNGNSISDPELILKLSNYRVSKIACSDHSSFAIASVKDFNLHLQNSRCDNLSLLALTEPERKILLSWGRGHTGVLALGDEEDRNVPTITDLLSHEMEIEDISCGAQHAIAILKDDRGDSRIFSWGDNSHG